MLSIKRALIFSGILLFVFFWTMSRNSDGSSMSLKSHIRGGARPDMETDAPEDSADKLVTQGNGSGASRTPRPRPANMVGEPLREQLAYQFPYDVSAKFPAFIWQTWKYTLANPRFSETHKAMAESWSKAHPDFIHEIITDQVALHLIKHLYSSVPKVWEAFVSLPTPILKADFFRYLVLYARGGIYSDIDTGVLKPATVWIPKNFRLNSIGLVIGIEADAGTRADWKDWYSRQIQFCQWTIQSKPGHPVLREIIARITEKTLKAKKEGKLRKALESVIEFTGPAAWSDTIFDYFNDDLYFDTTSGIKINWANFTGMKEPRKLGDVVVLPITSFSPGVGQMGAGEDDDPQAFVKHDFAGSWKPEVERHIGENEENRKARLKEEEEQRQKLKKLGLTP